MDIEPKQSEQVATTLEFDGKNMLVGLVVGLLLLLIAVILRDWAGWSFPTLEDAYRNYGVVWGAILFEYTHQAYGMGWASGAVVSVMFLPRHTPLQKIIWAAFKGGIILGFILNVLMLFHAVLKVTVGGFEGEAIFWGFVGGLFGIIAAILRRTAEVVNARTYIGIRDLFRTLPMIDRVTVRRMVIYCLIGVLSGFVVAIIVYSITPHYSI